MRFDQVVIVESGDMSGSVTSIGIDLQQLLSYSIQAVFTDAPVGTFKLQWSNDEVQVSSGSNPAANVVNWTDYTGTSQAVSAAGNYGWIGAWAGFRWIRLVYTRSSGSGTLNAVFCGKG